MISNQIYVVETNEQYDSDTGVSFSPCLCVAFSLCKVPLDGRISVPALSLSTFVSSTSFGGYLVMVLYSYGLDSYGPI